MRRQFRFHPLVALGFPLTLALAATSFAQSSGRPGQPVAAPPPPRTVITGSLALNSPQTVSNAVAGQGFNLMFSGTAGEAVSLAEVSDASPCAAITFRIARPDRSLLAGKDVCGSGSMNNITLPATGTYAVNLNPGSSSGSITLTLTRVATRSIAPGSPENVSSALAGQVFSLTFDGEAGQRVTIAETENTYPCGAMGFTLLKPNGSALATAHQVCGNISLEREPLPATGAYTVLINPGWAAGGATFTVSATGR
jgi:hypothetical protein